MSARDNILQRLRAAAGPAVQLPDVGAFHAQVSAAQAVSSPASRRALFCEKMSFWRGEIVRVNASNWPQTLRELCAAKGVRSLLYGEDGEHGAALRAAGIDGLTPYRRPAEEWKPEMFASIDAGFTSTRGAIAETGTLIVWPDSREPRLLSLVPPIHFALLDGGQIFDTFYQAQNVQCWSRQMPTNALLISGPSKTADIQVTLAYGAHGPKELVVLLLVDEEDLT